MSQRLAIGVLDSDPGWETILRQIGVWMERIDFGRLDPTSYSAIIVNRTLSPGEGSAIDTYLRSGGAVLDSGGYARHAHLETRSRSVAALSGGEPPFESVWLADVHARVDALTEARHLAGTVTLGEHGGGILAHVPFDVARVMRGSSSARRRFHSPLGQHPDEIVARVPRSPYRQIVEGALRWLHAERGLPFAHLRPFPGEASGIFALRIDSDYGTPRHMRRLDELARRHDVPMTIFLHVGAHIEHIELIGELSGHELASHGYRHRTFSESEANWGNIAEADQVLRAAGVRPDGFAAPTGRWSPGLDRALRDHGVIYSSEFTLDYDGLPFHPWTGNGLSSVLQMPVHPVSIGSLQRMRATDDAIVAYYRAVIDRLHAQRVPIVLYHHPLQEAWDALDEIVAYARRPEVPPMTMGSFARWWISRSRARFRATITDGALELARPIAGDDLRVALVAPDGRECSLGTAGTTPITSLPWRPAGDRTLAVPDDLLSIRRVTPTMLRHSLEDAISRFRQ